MQFELSNRILDGCKDCKLLHQRKNGNEDSQMGGIHQTIQKNSVGFIPWDGITVGKDRIP